MSRLGLRTARALGAGATISRGAAIWVSPETTPVRAFTSVQGTGCGTPARRTDRVPQTWCDDDFKFGHAAVPAAFMLPS